MKADLPLRVKDTPYKAFDTCTRADGVSWRRPGYTFYYPTKVLYLM